MEKIIFFFLIILVGCSKEKQLEKTNGSWNVHTLRVEDGEGFAYFSDEISGDFNIDYIGKKIDCNLNFKYINIQGTEILDSVIWNQLEFNLKNDNYFLFNSEGIPIELRIMLVTKNSLMVEYYDIQKFRLTRFVLNK